MYELSFPGGDPEAADTAASWVLGIARKECPTLASDAAAVAYKLVANAINHTASDRLIEVKASTADGVLRLEVRDPGATSENRDWTSIAQTARRFGGSHSEKAGHIGWAELEITA